VIDDFFLDASAMLAALSDEPGEGVVRAAITGGGEVAMSAVNYAELIGKLHGLGAAGVEALNRIDRHRYRVR
jgi:PIN domain nuclease of toxin-antitoxin system